MKIGPVEFIEIIFGCERLLAAAEENIVIN